MYFNLTDDMTEFLKNLEKSRIPFNFFKYQKQYKYIITVIYMLVHFMYSEAVQ